MQKPREALECEPNPWPADMTLAHIERFQASLSDLGSATQQAVAWVCAAAKRRVSRSVPESCGHLLPEELTDAQIDQVVNAMPLGLGGFLKHWGYRQFARALEDTSELSSAHWPADLSVQHVERIQASLSDLGGATQQAFAWICAAAKNQLAQSPFEVFLKTPPERLSDEKIDKVFTSLSGDFYDFTAKGGYRQFARMLALERQPPNRTRAN